MIMILLSLMLMIPQQSVMAFGLSDAQKAKERGDFLYYHGDVEEAIQSFEKAVRLDPDMYEAQLSLVNMYLMLKKQDKAIEAAKSTGAGSAVFGKM